MTKSIQYIQDWGGACYDWKRSADLGKQKAQEQLLKYCNIDGTLKKTSSASGAGKVDETTNESFFIQVDKQVSPQLDFNLNQFPELKELYYEYLADLEKQNITPFVGFVILVV